MGSAKYDPRAYPRGGGESGEKVIDRLQRENDALRQMIADMLQAADASWENTDNGHDWVETCARAREMIWRDKVNG